MYTTIGPEALGIHGLSLAEAIDLARQAGFAGLAFNPRQVADAVDERGAAAVCEEFARAGVRPAFFNLPVAWRDEERWQADFKELPRLGGAARDIGAARTVTYILSGSDERPYDENFAWHVARLQPIAEVLRDAGCRFGLEYVGTTTFREGFRYPFIFTLDGIQELVAAIGLPNVGIMVDSWHLFASGGSLSDLDRLTNQDVVVAHVNDAPAGLTWDEQIDTIRALPLETGEIDLAGFMHKLREIGYDGPVMPEPFSRRINELAASDPLAAARETGLAMKALWNAAGLT